MKLVAGTALLVAVALGASACASRHGVATKNARLSFPSKVPASLVSYIRSSVKMSEGTVSTVAVYGPGSRSRLVKASSGAGMHDTAKEKTMRFYLVVLDGNFVCNNCSGPPPGGIAAPRGTVETFVWSPEEGGTDYSIGNSAGPGVPHLRRFATIAVS